MKYIKIFFHYIFFRSEYLKFFFFFLVKEYLKFFKEEDLMEKGPQLLRAVYTDNSRLAP